MAALPSTRFCDGLAIQSPRSGGAKRAAAKPFFDGHPTAWEVLREAGVAAPVDNEILGHVSWARHSRPT